MLAFALLMQKWCWVKPGIFLRGLLGSGAWLQEWTQNLPSSSQWKEEPVSPAGRKAEHAVTHIKPHPSISLGYSVWSTGNHGSIFLQYSSQPGWWIHGKTPATFSTQWNNLVLLFETNLGYITHSRLAWATWESVSKKYVIMILYMLILKHVKCFLKRHSFLVSSRGYV